MAQNSTDPYINPKDDPNNPLKYIASNSLTAVALFIVLNTAFIHSFWCSRYRTKWMLPLVIGEYCYAIGFGIRFVMHYYPDSMGIYVAENFFIVLSPCAFIAANYVLLGRIAKFLVCDEYVPLPLNKITRVFVLSDISTFLIQASGGGLSTSKNASVAASGSHIFLAGLVLQLASFLVFFSIFLRFLYKIYTLRPDIWMQDQTRHWFWDWRTLAGSLTVSSIGILVRSGYRVAELSYGYHGFLATTEAYFYLLDTLPLVIANLVYIPCWPGRFIHDKPTQEAVESKSSPYSSTV
ncbi:hypothetical protein SCLCIDRAFT_104952 [Scleroderma citrinum Foug A]|uniref:RTA1-domain-containing protein n=1 Tax=Scleroderma citrinum Foug A TaxID=1036808 RepID=A0A0C3ELJ8_9AGAM|nr:hypothetical protein SCLCIDRAFT_104952 [Scleroderma citrinum Foug A]